MKPSVFIWLLLVAETVLFGTPPDWDFTRPQADWGRPRNLKMRRTAEGLELTITGPDSSLDNGRVRFRPHEVGRFRIEYKATGFPGSTHGELFFGGIHSSGRLTDANRFFIPPLATDGQWHEIVLDAKTGAIGGEASWLAMQTITHLRLDLVNEFPGKIVLRRITALPPTLAPLTRLDQTTVPHGVLLPREMLEHGALAMRLPEGPHRVWMRRSPSLARPPRIEAIPALAPPSRAISRGNWMLAGQIMPPAGGQITLQIPSPLDDAVDALLLTPDTTVPQDAEDSTPMKVAAAPFGAPARKFLRDAGRFDPLAPYFKGKMIAPQGHLRTPGRLWCRKSFAVPATISRALLQCVADDSVQAVRLNGQLLPGPWTTDWRRVSHREVTRLLRPGTQNTLEIEYQNDGGAGGLLFEIGMLDGAGRFTCVCSDETVVGGKGAPQPKGLPVQCEQPPPYAPWTVVLDYQDIEPAHGTASVAVTPPSQCMDPESLAIPVHVTGTPALSGGEAFFVRLLDQRGNLLAFRSARLKEWAAAPDADGAWHFTVAGFALPKYGAAIKGTVQAGLYHRGAKGGVAPFTVAARPAPAFSGEVERAEIADRGNGPRLEINGAPRFVVGLSTFHEGLGPTGLEGADSPVQVRSFLAGGGECDWWTGPDTYDFSKVEARASGILEDFPNALLAIWVHCQPPHWYARRHPERISLESNGRPFPYAFSTVTFSDADYRRDAAKAVAALVAHCERHFGRRVLLYNLCGGISLEWQGWGLLSLAQRKVLADYSPAAKRDFLAYARRHAPGLALTGIPSFEDRVAAGQGLFRDPAKEAAAALYDRYYSDAIAECILEIAAAAKQACGRRKLVGCYYGYAYEYCNKNYSVNSGGHNALGSIAASPDIDIVLSPPSYGVRQIGSCPGSDMKSFASLHAHGKLSVLEDDTRTHLDPPSDFYQTLNAAQTEAVLRRNWGMALAMKTFVWHLPIESHRAFSSPEIAADLRRVQQAGQMLCEEDRARGAEIAVVLDEGSRQFLHPRANQFPTPSRTQNYYSHNGLLRLRPRRADILLGELVYFQRIALNQCGAPVDYLLLEDVPRLAGKYKLFIFLDAFADTPLLEESLEAIRRAGHSILIAFGAGFLGKNGATPAGLRLRKATPGPLLVEMRNFTHPGLAGECRFGTDAVQETRFIVEDAGAQILGVYADTGLPAIAVKPMAGSAGKVWFCGSNVLPAGFIAAVAAEAGVHLYAAPGDTLFAGCGTVTLHSATAGRKTIRLPQAADVVDLYSGEVVARNATEFTYTQPAYTTRTFLLGDAERIRCRLGN